MAAKENPTTTDHEEFTEVKRNLMSSHQIKSRVNDDSVLIDLVAKRIKVECLTEIKSEGDAMVEEEISVKEEKFDIKTIKEEIPEVDYKLVSRVTVDLVPIQITESSVKVERKIKIDQTGPEIYLDPSKEVDESILPELSSTGSQPENLVEKFKRTSPSPQGLCAEGPLTETGLPNLENLPEDRNRDRAESEPSRTCCGTSLCQCVRCRQKTPKKVPHLFKLRGIDVSYCDLCNKIFYSASRFKLHKETKCGTVKFFTCEYCDKRVLRQFYFRHVVNVHKKGPHTEVTCDLCQKVYPNRASLKEHVTHLHNSEKFECAHCSKLCKNKDELKSHINRWHMTLTDLRSFAASTEKSVQKVMCEVCGKIFSNKTIATHQRIHTAEKPFVCDVCGKRFRTGSNLHQHSFTHSDKRPFLCDVCEKSFRIKHHLRQHMAVHGMAKSAKRRKLK